VATDERLLRRPPARERISRPWSSSRLRRPDPRERVRDPPATSDLTGLVSLPAANGRTVSRTWAPGPPRYTRPQRDARRSSSTHRGTEVGMDRHTDTDPVPARQSSGNRGTVRRDSYSPSGVSTGTTQPKVGVGSCDAEPRARPREDQSRGVLESWAATQRVGTPAPPAAFVGRRLGDHRRIRRLPAG
jgi:hypothetical protein